MPKKPTKKDKPTGVVAFEVVIQEPIAEIGESFDSNELKNKINEVIRRVNNP